LIAGSGLLGDDGEKLTYFSFKTATFIHTPIGSNAVGKSVTRGKTLAKKHDYSLTK
jgi:hypothetical protein